MSKQFVAVLLVCIVAIAAVNIMKAEAAGTDIFKDCYDTCHKDCFKDGSGGNGYTFCETKCVTECGGKDIKAKFSDLMN